MLIYRNKNVISQQLDDFLIDNPIDCYCINDRSGLKVKDDDSVDVILSKDAPEDTTNWLPVGDGGFHQVHQVCAASVHATALTGNQEALSFHP